MKFTTLFLAGLITLLTVSCGTLPERPKNLGPQSSESSIPWNTRQPGENQGLLGGLNR